MSDPRKEARVLLGKWVTSSVEAQNPEPQNTEPWIWYIFSFFLWTWIYSTLHISNGSTCLFYVSMVSCQMMKYITSLSVPVVLPIKSGVWQPTAKHRSKTKVGGEEKRPLIKYCIICKKQQTPCSSAKHRKYPFVPQKTETQNHTQKYLSVHPYLCFWSPRLLGRWPSPFRILESVCMAHAVIALPQLPAPGAQGCCQLLQWAMTVGSGACHLTTQFPEPSRSCKCSGQRVCAWIPEEEKGRVSSIPSINLPVQASMPSKRVKIPRRSCLFPS